MKGTQGGFQINSVGISCLQITTALINVCIETVCAFIQSKKKKKEI